MVEQVTHRDELPACRSVREIVRYGLIQVQLAILYLQHHGNGGELLAHGGRLEHGFRADRHLQFDIRVAITLGHDDFAVLENADSDARHFFPLHFGLHELIHPRFQIGRASVSALAWAISTTTIAKAAMEKAARVQFIDFIAFIGMPCSPLLSGRWRRQHPRER